MQKLLFVEERYTKLNLRTQKIIAGGTYRHGVGGQENCRVESIQTKR